MREMPEAVSTTPVATGDRPLPLPAGFEDSGAPEVSAAFGAHVVMFWVLVGMSALVFAPCILVPIWLETEDLARTEAQIAANNAKLDARIAEQERVMRALPSDPLVTERIARRDLRFRRAGEQVQPVANGPAPALSLPPEIDLSSPSASDAAAPAETSAWVRWCRRWLPDLPWADLFGKPPYRTVFMVMAGVLLVAAFVLFGHGETSNARPAAGRSE